MPTAKYDPVIGRWACYNDNGGFYWSDTDPNTTRIQNNIIKIETGGGLYDKFQNNTTANENLPSYDEAVDKILGENFHEDSVPRNNHNEQINHEFRPAVGDSHSHNNEYENNRIFHSPNQTQNNSFVPSPTYDPAPPFYNGHNTNPYETPHQSTPPFNPSIPSNNQPPQMNSQPPFYNQPPFISNSPTYYPPLVNQPPHVPSCYPPFIQPNYNNNNYPIPNNTTIISNPGTYSCYPQVQYHHVPPPHHQHHHHQTQQYSNHKVYYQTSQGGGYYYQPLPPSHPTKKNHDTTKSITKFVKKFI